MPTTVAGYAQAARMKGEITVGTVYTFRAIQVKVCWMLMMGTVLWVTGGAVALAGEAGGEKVTPPVDCRYETATQASAAEGSGSTASIPFPDGDVFRPLFADPKQPQTFASLQAARNRVSKTSTTVGSVGFGENFGFYSSRDGCNGWQVGILAGVFSQFDMNAPSTDLINADYVVGIPLSWRSGLFSTRVRLSHQSTHLGDEFVLNNPGVGRVNFSYEEAEAILSMDAPGGWGRLYAGGGYLVHREPATLDRLKAQAGVELRGPTWSSGPIERFVSGPLVMTPVLGADFKSFEQLNWTLNVNVVGGLEFARAGALRRFRILVNYYHGNNPYGQFYGQKVESVGLGVYLAF
ncbi:MAG: DUF1207 domain-containing protein [Nitrospirota bacterium]|nr:DUF1207 domain-containing protein [Nitrospirota bacterium]MDP3599450.1 DUF1207 domain-containing protein [Nitrospirota bacterium]